MKKSLFIITFLISIQVFAQSDYSIINVYRSKAFCIGCLPVQILIDGKPICTLTDGTQLEYQVFHPRTVLVTITDGKSYTKSLKLDVKKGDIYHLEADARLPRYLGFNLKKLDKPIKESKMSENSIVRYSDTGEFYEAKVDVDTSDTDFTEEKIKQYWSAHKMHPIEGLYERVSSNTKYKLAILKDQNEYKIIYISGAKGTGWQEGDIKGTLRRTAKNGVFISDWKMLNKTYKNDVNIIFDDTSMNVVSDSKIESKDTYIKTYPLPDEKEEM